MLIRNCYKWLPRILAILYILFLSVSALDSFLTGNPLLQEIVGALIHLAPVYVLLIALIVAWKYPILGGGTFILVAGFMTYFYKFYLHPIAFIIMGATPIFIGILFISQGFIKKKTQFI